VKKLSNCWIEAMRLWLRFWARYPIAVRRSHKLPLLPHFSVALPSRWRHFQLVEYEPPRNKRWTPSDCVAVFRGRYRVTEFRVVRVRWFDTMKDLQLWRASSDGDR
jgi:hypothetical protein